MGIIDTNIKSKLIECIDFAKFVKFLKIITEKHLSTIIICDIL